MTTWTITLSEVATVACLSRQRGVTGPNIRMFARLLGDRVDESVAASLRRMKQRQFIVVEAATDGSVLYTCAPPFNAYMRSFAMELVARSQVKTINGERLARLMAMDSGKPEDESLVQRLYVRMMDCQLQTLMKCESKDTIDAYYQVTAEVDRLGKRGFALADLARVVSHNDVDSRAFAAASIRLMSSRNLLVPMPGHDGGSYTYKLQQHWPAYIKAFQDAYQMYCELHK